MSGLDLNAIANGALVSAVGAVGRWLVTAARNPRGRGAEDLSVARWFETYRLTSSLPEFPSMHPAHELRLGEVLPSDDVQAALRELLCARLTDAPETSAAAAREAFRLTLTTADPGLAPYAQPLADYYDDRICDLVGELEGMEPSVLPQIRTEALSARMIAVLDAIARHTAVLGTGETRTESAFLTSYARHVHDHHGKLQPPDFDRRRLVPIDDIYVPARVYENISTERRVPLPREQSPPLDLNDLAERLDRMVLLGDPGGGKTTAAKVLMVHLSSRTDRVPFLVTLREYAATDPPQRSVVEHIAHDLTTFYQCPPPPGFIDRLLLTGRGVVIFDGLDELLDTSRRADVTARVERFCTEYPLAPVLVTSRVIGYDEARLDDQQFTAYRLGGFTDDDIRAYAWKWFAQEEDARPEDAEAFLTESASVPDLRSNPLLLALMCILYRGEGSLPRDRAGVYEACANLLFRKWDGRRRIHAELRAGHLLEPALRHLAWWMYTGPAASSSVTERELIATTTEFFHRRGFETIDDARDAATEFVEFCRGRMWVFTDAGTTATGEKLYAFTHRTFLEYFAAAQLAYDSDTPEHLARTLAPRVARNEWAVVSELAVQIKDNTSTEGARRIYTTLLGEKRRRSVSGRSGVLRFLARTLRSVDPSPPIIRELTRETLRFLYTGDPDSDECGLPLAWLLASCRVCRSIVDEEISVWITSIVASADPVIRVKALRLATSLDIPLGPWGGEGPDLPAYDIQRKFWVARAEKYAQQYSVHIVNAAVDHPDLLDLALSRGLITVDNAIALCGGLTMLLQYHRVGIFNLLRGSYLVHQTFFLAHGQSSAMVPSTIASFEAVGNFLVSRPQAPWTSQPVDRWSAYRVWDQPGRTDLMPSDLGKVAYLGAAATLLISAEDDETGIQVLNGDPSRLGPLSDLYPYMESRADSHKSFSPLADLPVPSQFKQLFRNWAEGKIDFTKPA